MKNALKGTYEEGGRPRAAIANSIARTVRNSLKDQPDTVVERAILQARQEADLLYMLVIEVNVVVQESLFQREREYLFFLGFVEALMRSPVTEDALQQLCDLTLVFVNEVFELDCVISQISAERFGAHSILFSDSDSQLREQIDLAHQALEHFDFWARQLKHPELTAEGICEKLRPIIDRQVARRVVIARGGMLAVFGEEGDFQANLDQLFQLCDRGLIVSTLDP
jgi:hypothetical protein